MPRWAVLALAMLALLKLLGGLLVGVFRSHAASEAEMAFLRQQFVVLKRSAPARLRLRTADRLIFVWLYRLCPSVRQAAVVFKPKTLVRWHRSGVRLYGRWKSRRCVGRPAVLADIRDSHCQLKRPWYPRRVGGAAGRVGELLCSPIMLPAEAERVGKRRSGSVKLTMPSLASLPDLQAFSLRQRRGRCPAPSRRRPV
jgi:hypothetical protein